MKRYPPLSYDQSQNQKAILIQPCERTTAGKENGGFADNLNFIQNFSTLAFSDSVAGHLPSDDRRLPDF
jgi:hypothetical protein